MGVADKRDVLLAQTDNVTPSRDQSLGFKEIYALADENEQPFHLNDIEPAAGSYENFPSGFRGLEDSALADFKPKVISQHNN